jgi:hydroxyacylglutathione hydrolase
MLNIEIISCLNDNYSYILHDELTGLVGVVDPSEFKPIDNFISKKFKKIDFILNTHHHYDHVGGNKELKKKYKTKVVGSKTDKYRIPGIDIMLFENDKFNFGEVCFEIISIPGHTAGHIAFYSEVEKIIFTGDTLFSLGCGKIFEGTYNQMFNSLNKIKNLPKDTKIYCGHEYTHKNLQFCLKYDGNNKMLYDKLISIKKKLAHSLPTVPTTLEEELSTNIFLRCDNAQVKSNLKMTDSLDELVFEKLRNLKDEF